MARGAVDGAGVARVRWPDDAVRLGELRDRGVPRLVVIAGCVPPPPGGDCLEDWVRADAPAWEIDARTHALDRRAAHHGARPTLDCDGLLRHRDDWVSLSPVEVALVGPLLERFGAVVAREALVQEGWPDGAPTRNALDVHVLRLRRRIAPLALEIRTVRARGYLMQAAAPPDRS